MVIRGLRQLKRTLNNIKDAEYQKTSAMALQELIDEGFEREVDPYGAKWKPRKDNEPHKILGKTGTMRRSIKPRIGRNQVRFRASARSRKGFPYPRVHQLGGKRHPRRRFLPDEGMPDKYGKRLKKVIWDRILGIWRRG